MDTFADALASKTLTAGATCRQRDTAIEIILDGRGKYIVP
jgi:hypothetical protein